MATPESDLPRTTPPQSPAIRGGEIGRLRSDATFNQRFRDLTIAFARGASSSLGLGAALNALVLEANTLLGARCTSVWLHQRRSYDLALVASSDDRAVGAAGPVPTDERDAPPARGLRLAGPTVVTAGADLLLLAPLRGWRRALGTLVIEGPFSDALGDPQLVDFACELSRQLSAAIEHIQLLEEIIRQRRLLEDTFDSLLELVVVTDEAFRVVQVNDAFAARVGRPRAELLDSPLTDLVGRDMADWVATVATAAPPAAGPAAARTARFDDPRLGGIFAVTVTRLAHESHAGAGHVVVARDITRPTELEREREALRERLAHSEKLASLGQFVAGIAHEMNNPLQGVLGHLELMITTSVPARPLRRELRRIYQDADRAAKIVRNLMVFTGARRMTRRRLRLDRLLSRVLASRAPALRRAGIDVVRDEAADLPKIAGDPLMLHQALLNILINAEHAIKATGGGGRIEVRTRLAPGSGQLAVTIRDSGAGIPPDVLPRMFDPFFTTRDVGEGTGLGLAITYGIIQEHGGRIHAANAPDGGAILTLELPAAAG